MFKKTILATASAAVMAPAFAASMFVLPTVAHAVPNISCTVPNNVVCTISSSKGLKEVTIYSNTGRGTVAIVDKDYRSCPKTVNVSWDSAYPMSSKKIVECGSMGFKLKN